jgi:hypothetical protein
MKMGRGLIRLYLVLWSLWLCFGVATNYKELATYLGYDRWTVAKAIERAEEYRKSNCKEDEKSRLDISCLYPGGLSPDEFVTESQVELTVWMFKVAMLKAPLFFFVLVVILYWLIKWVVAGFRKKKDAQT